MIDEGRQADLRLIEAHRRGADTLTKKKLAHVEHTIRHETPLIRDMRAKLIQAQKEGNHAEIQDIHDFTERKARFHVD